MMGIGSMICVMIVSRLIERKLPSYQPHGHVACTMNGGVIRPSSQKKDSLGFSGFFCGYARMQSVHADKEFS